MFFKQLHTIIYSYKFRNSSSTEFFIIFYKEIFTIIFTTNFEYITFDDTEKTTFRYNARALSRTLYGTPVFWQLLLHVNEVDNEGDFELNGPVKVPIAHKFHTYVSQVYNLRRNELGDSFKYM